MTLSSVTLYFTVAPLLLVSVTAKLVPTGPVVSLPVWLGLGGAVVAAFAAGGEATFCTPLPELATAAMMMISTKPPSAPRMM